MDNDPTRTTFSFRRFPARFRPWLVVLLVVVFAGFIRVRLLDMPLERDEGEYAYAGQLILQGIPPYELAYNMKLPGTYVACALGMAVFGQTNWGIHLTLLVVNSLTTVFVFVLGRKLFGPAAGLVAGAAYATMSVSPEVYGLAAHATQFVVLFAVPATWLLWKACEADDRKMFFLSGGLFGLAFLMKQPGICFGLFGAMVLLGRAVRSKSVFTREGAGTFLMFGAGLVLPFVFLCLATVVAGDFSRFWFWTFSYAGAYAVSVPLANGVSLLAEHLKHGAALSWGFWGLALAGLPFGWRDPSGRKATVFLLLLWGCSFLGTASGLYFRWHYFVLVLPAFAILLGRSVAILLERGRGSRLAALGPALFVMFCLWTVFHQRRLLFELSPFQASQTIYQGNPFVESLAVAGYIRSHSAADAQVAVVGSEPEIYFYAQRHSATGYIYTYPLVDSQPYAGRMQREMVSEIESNRPAYLVLVMYKTSWLIRPASDVTILHWFDAYAKAYYDRVGVIGVRSTGEPVGVWDADAGSFHEPLDRFIMIYRRRPDPAPGPVRRD